MTTIDERELTSFEVNVKRDYGFGVSLDFWEGTALFKVPQKELDQDKRMEFKSDTYEGNLYITKMIINETGIIGIDFMGDGILRIIR